MKREDAAAVEGRIKRRLEFVYGAQRAPGIAADVMRLVEEYGRSDSPRGEPWSEKDALLITYGDSIRDEDAPPLSVLHGFLRERVGDLFTMVHLLPLYPYSSDDGFAVKDFRKVRAALGVWADVKGLAEDYSLVFDAVINHVSASSRYMERYAAGEAAYEDFFIELDPKTDTSSVLRTRSAPLLHDYETAAGTKWLWTTFSRDHVDLNYANPRVLLEILDVLLFYAARGAKVIRLDAIPYLWKELGTSCAHLPQTHELIKLFRDVYDLAFPEVLLLSESNVPHHENLSYLGDGGDEAQIIYNFSLAPLVVFAIATGDATKLTAWAKTVENPPEGATFLNITATHDGIGMRPTEGILSEDERRFLVELTYAHNGEITGKKNSDGTVSVYELNVNYFDAVNDPNADNPIEVEVRRFILSQAIALSFVGIPGVYIHSLLGSRNDKGAVAETGIARRINRARLDLGELRGELDAAGSLRARVFDEYARLLTVRARQRAFHPNAAQEVLDLGAAFFALRRRHESGDELVALHNVTARHVEGDLGDDGDWVDLLEGKPNARLDGRSVGMAPWQVRWLVPDRGASSADTRAFGKGRQIDGNFRPRPRSVSRRMVLAAPCGRPAKARGPGSHALSCRPRRTRSRSDPRSRPRNAHIRRGLADGARRRA